MWGFSTTDRIHDSPPALLRDSLSHRPRSSSISLRLAPPCFKSAGNSIWTNPQYRYAKAFDPATILIMLGTNDSKPALWTPFSANFYPDYDSLIDELQALPGDARILLLTPPKAFSSNFGIQDSVLQNAIIPQIRLLARSRCLEVLDIYTRTDTLSSLFPDGIHPDDSASALMAHAMLEALNRPSFNITQSGNTLNAPPSFAYQWYRDGDTIPGATGQFFTASISGIYKVAIQPDSLLADVHLSDSLNVNVVGREGAVEDNVAIWPNPAKTHLRIQCGEMGPFMVRIFSMEGRLMFVEPAGQEGYLELELSNWPQGLYLAEIAGELGVVRKRIAVRR